MSDDLSPEAARSALDRADRAARRITLARARFVRRDKLVLAGLFALVVLAWGLVEPFGWRVGLTLGAIALIPLWLVVRAGADRAVSRADAPRRRLWELDVTAVLFLLVLLAGEVVDRTWGWVVGAALVAVPLVASAVFRRDL